MESLSTDSVPVDYNYYAPGQESSSIDNGTRIIQDGNAEQAEGTRTNRHPAQSNVDVARPSDGQAELHGDQESVHSTDTPLCKAVLIQHQQVADAEADDYQFSPSSSADTDPNQNCAFMPDVAIDVCPGPETSLFANLEEVDVYRGTESSSADCSLKHLEKLVNSMPDLVVGKIFEYLYWKEKIYAAEAFPTWERILNSPLGWELFENDRGYAHCYEPLVSNHYVLEELACIAQYGKYFVNCIIWIHNFLPIDSPVDTDFTILKCIQHNCTRLKSVSIFHPPNLSSSALTLSYLQYIAPLQNILTSDGRVRLHMYRLLYSSVESGSGAVELLHFYNSHNILKKITTLDFSHGLILAASIIPLNNLMMGNVLQTLKCPVQNVTTTIIQQLLNKQLTDLYLVNDEHTLNLHYVEKGNIRWPSLNIKRGKSFNVHYIFKSRTVSPVHLCPNPYVRSLVLDSLCSSVSRALLRCIADTYSRTLRVLAFILSVWEPLVPFSDLEDLANNFQYMGKRLVDLRSVILNLIVPSDALLALAHNSPRLQHFLVYEHKIFFDGKTAVTPEQLMDLRQEVSAGLRRPWIPVAPEDSLYRIGSASQQALLFEESVNQWEGFW